MLDNSINTEIQLGLPPLNYVPFGTVLVLDYKPAEKIGLVHLPSGTKPPIEFVTCKVIAAGPKVEQAKVGTTILIGAKAIMGVKHDGRLIFVTQENTILGLVEGMQSNSEAIIASMFGKEPKDLDKVGKL